MDLKCIQLLVLFCSYFKKEIVLINLMEILGKNRFSAFTQNILHKENTPVTKPLLVFSIDVYFFFSSGGKRKSSGNVISLVVLRKELSHQENFDNLCEINA